MQGEIPVVLIVDDEAEIGNFFRYLLERKGYQVIVATSGADASGIIESRQFNVAMVDLKLPDSDGLTLLQAIKAKRPRCEVVIMTGYSTTRSAVKAIQMGAFDYIEKPFEDIAEVESLVQKAIGTSTGSRELGECKPDWLDISDQVGFRVGNTLQMKRLVSIAYKIAKKNINVLIQGETGTGKEVLARFVHAASNRSDRIFIPVNCGALPDNLLDSELFGHEKGAFTGAASLRKGIFELANQGTLFLDEIGEANPSIQVKLLRAIETGEFLRVGGERPIRTDVRIIAATNVDLEEAVRERLFREDLFYRLDVVRLTLPPLRDRREDIPELVNYFIKRYSYKRDMKALEVSPGAMELLVNHSWPGNIRELANTVDQAVALCDGPVIQAAHIPEKVAGGSAVKVNARKTGESQESTEISQSIHQLIEGIESEIASFPPEELYRFLNAVNLLESKVHKTMSSLGLPRPAPPSLKDLEARAMSEALSYHKGNITLAARTLGIGRNTLYRKMREYNISPE
ncbi:MAG: sigma-54-dependent transcriptional regulator [Bacillota bacterium]